MAVTPAATQEHYAEVQRLQLLALTAARRSWTRIDPARISESWRDALTDLTPVIGATQRRTATSALAVSGLALAEQGVWVAPTAWVDPEAFVGLSSYGHDVEAALYSPAPAAKQAIAAGAPTAAALSHGRAYLDQLVRTIIADTGRAAASIDIAARPGVGYVRMLNPPSCGRCTVLAGRFYRWNAGFARHPHCDCVHVTSAAGSTKGARDEGLVDDPYEHFASLSPAEQDRLFTKGGAQAVRDGGDLYQVVNSRRGAMQTLQPGQERARVGKFTTEGTTRRGSAAAGLRPGQRRMTPDTIYATSRTREEALQALRDQGYILPGGQVPGGSMRGRVEGFGQMGAGGARKAAAAAVDDARTTGVRDPTSRYTMTAAERRLYDAQQRYAAVLAGRNPYTSPGFGNTPDPTGARRSYGAAKAGPTAAPLTPQIAAQVEADYRRWLASGGQIH